MNIKMHIPKKGKSPIGIDKLNEVSSILKSGPLIGRNKIINPKPSLCLISMVLRGADNI